ncbi:MAG: hypothetical protein KY453_09140 [Gemmatimonadetes bacterium]|nr:hypothetical protein [Gemmatimonadota bacterium]
MGLPARTASAARPSDWDIASWRASSAIAAGNSGDPELIGSVAAHLSSDDPVVAEAAEWALARLQAPCSVERQVA